MTNALVSIITPTFNSVEYIGSTIESVLNQTYTNWELIITDDNSKDNTVVAIKSFSKGHPRIRVYELDKNSGAAQSRNNSIKYAQGRFIAFLDADDKWLPDKLEKQVAFMLENKLDLSYTGYYKINEKNERIGSLLAKHSLSYNELLRNNYIGCLTAMYDTKKLNKVYMPDIRKRQDWALWLRISKRTTKIKGIPEPLAEYRIRENSISKNKFEMVKYNWKVYRNIEGFSWIKSMMLFTRFLFYFAIKKIK